MAATMLGAGAFIDAFRVRDGNAWLWSSKPGSASRVNSNSGRVDLRQPLVDARGHRVRITQNDKYLILHDLDTGRVTSVDLVRMGFTGTLNVGTSPDVAIVLHGDRAAIVDRGRGLVRGLDPVTLRTSRDVLRLPPPLAGGDFDRDGRLWLAVPSQGTVVAARVGDDGVRTERTEAVAEPDSDLTLTTVNHGAIAVDRGTGKLTVVGEEDLATVRVPGGLSGAEVPRRTVGKLLAVTAAQRRSVVTLELGDSQRPRRFSLPAGIDPGVAVPYAGRVYVPDSRNAVVLVFSASGKRLAPVPVAGAKGELELEVREGKLFINSPDTSQARVVDRDGTVREVDKYRDDVAGGEGLKGRVMPAPRPGDSDGKDDKQGKPGPPVPVTAVAGDEQVDLTWGAAAANGAAIQRYRITWDGGSREVGGGRQHAVIGGLRNGESYSFKVTARNKHGVGPPAYSEKVTPTDQIPPVPRNVKAAVAPEQGGARVTWDDVDGARDYVVRTLRNGAPDPSVPATTVSGSEALIRGLTYGERYRFTVMARNDSGAGSKPSAPSNEVRVYAAPGAPRNPSAAGTGETQVTVRWQAAPANGDPITKYVVTPSVGKAVTVAGSARQAKVDGLPTGQTVEFTIVAYNAAGAGDPAKTSAKVGRAPTVRIQNTSGNYRSITVTFTVNGHGMQVRNCSARIEGGGSASGSCSRLTVGRVYPGRTYKIVVTASNDIGSGQDSQRASTKNLFGTVTCKNDTSSSDPERRTYCNDGVSMYWSNSQTSSKAGKAYDGDRKQARCKKIDPYPPGDERAIETAYVYNNNKSSRWWIKMPDGRWIPHIWLNLDAGDNDTDNLAILPRC